MDISLDLVPLEFSDGFDRHARARRAVAGGQLRLGSDAHAKVAQQAVANTIDEARVTPARRLSGPLAFG